jgi:hypothetical protein
MPIAAAVFFACLQSPLGPLDQLAAAEQAPGAPVVLELFTSQGCSSCPPADKLLRKLADHPKLGARVLPLAFHVDYWDDLGWKDPHASPAWSQRQRDYAAALRAPTVYTPQLVIDGQQEEVGSSSERIVDALGIALARPKTVAIALACEPNARTSTELPASYPSHTTVRVDALLDTSHRGTVQLHGFLTSNEPDTDVPRGENAGRSLPNAFAVLSAAPVLPCERLEDAATLDAAVHAPSGPRLQASEHPPLSLGKVERQTGCLRILDTTPERKEPQQRLVVLAQDSATLAVRGAAALDLPCL